MLGHRVLLLDPCRPFHPQLQPEGKDTRISYRTHDTSPAEHTLRN